MALNAMTTSFAETERYIAHDRAFSALQLESHNLTATPSSRRLSGLSRGAILCKDITIGHVLCALGTILIVRAIADFTNTYIQRRRFAQFADENGCAPITARQKSFLASMRHKLRLLSYRDNDLLDDLFAAKYRTQGPTYALHDKHGRPIVVHTIDPVNLKAVLTTSWSDWRPSKSRANTIYPLGQGGLLLTEGAVWLKNRKLIQRRMGGSRAKDCRKDEEHIQSLFNAIGPARQDRWTGTVDLLDLFHRLALDMSTSYLLGTSADSQATGIRDVAKKAAMTEFDLIPANRKKDMTYYKAYETVREFFSWRSKLGSLYWTADSLEYRRACEKLNSFADELIAEAMQRSKSAHIEDERFKLINDLMRDLGDPLEVRNVVMDLFIAGQNMTGTIAAWVFAQLERHPDIYQQLRAEVIDKFGAETEPKVPITWHDMQACTTMQHVILETLRMYPLLANIGRNAKCDTILPRGGGPDGQQPIAVPKGAAITINVYLMHRREQEWGPDASDFKPDRWVGKKYGSEYAPFGAGPRVCVGQQLAMTEISFLITRMLQRFSHIRAPEGQNNLVKGYRVVVAPKNGVKVQLRQAV